MKIVLGVLGTLTSFVALVVLIQMMFFNEKEVSSFEYFVVFSLIVIKIAIDEQNSA